MKTELTPHEARVLGCLLEKEVTTPEQYPLSLNTLTSACNQKSNRDPVLSLDEATVQQTLDALLKRRLVSDRSGYGGRVTKYKQLFCNTELGPLQFADLEKAILCELLLRGPQSAGELRTRCQRMAPVAESSEVEGALLNLSSHEQGPFVVLLPRQAGQRDPRWMHLLSGEVKIEEGPAAAGTPLPARTGIAERVARLEAEVAALQAALAAIRDRLA